MQSIFSLWFWEPKTRENLRMSFAIMRCKKLKTAGGVASSLQHCFRERETLNADPELLSKNQHALADNVDNAMGKMRERLPLKRRKDAVLMVEYMMTASPEWFAESTKEEQREFFNKSLAWLCGKYGTENVIVATIHNDETTPHMSAFVTPITKDGRLSAKEFIGNKKKMSDDQTSYAEKVEHLGLKRGVKGSKAKHQTIKKFYELTNKSLNFHMIKPEDLEPKKFRGAGLLKHLPLNLEVETKEGIASRISNQVDHAFVVARNLKHIEREAKMLRDIASEAQSSEKRLKKELVAKELADRGLTKEQLQKIEEIKSMMKAENEEKEKQRKALLISEKKRFRR